jgi:NTP pyrophosphatase (non-canonical NTP hydrolase)
MQSEIFLNKKAPTLTEIQDYVSQMVRRRGFENETIEDVLLLFVEEVGELARAIRGFIGLKISRNRVESDKNLRLELADCLIYLMDIANLANIKLEDALREKEKTNSKRKWHSGKAQSS